MLITPSRSLLYMIQNHSTFFIISGIPHFFQRKPFMFPIRNSFDQKIILFFFISGKNKPVPDIVLQWALLIFMFQHQIRDQTGIVNLSAYSFNSFLICMCSMKSFHLQSVIMRICKICLLYTSIGQRASSKFYNLFHNNTSHPSVFLPLSHSLTAVFSFQSENLSFIVLKNTGICKYFFIKN